METLDRRAAGRAGRREPHAPPYAQRAAVPRPDEGVRRVAGDVRRRLGAPHPRLPLRAAAPATSTPSSSQEGKTLIFGLEAISEPDERGFRTVLATINGQMRPVNVRDRNVASEVAAAEKADTAPARPRRRAVPGRRHRRRREGRPRSQAGDTVATIEAMKMEASITAPIAGTVERIALSGTQAVDGGDLVLVLS